MIVGLPFKSRRRRPKSPPERRVSRAFPGIPHPAPESMTNRRQTTDRPVTDSLAALAEFERAEEFLHLREVVASWPATRRELVARLREEIACGLYRADERRIAAGLIEEEAALPDGRGTTRP